MAKMKPYRPLCNMEDCFHRATYEIDGDDGTKMLYCGSHVKKALFDTMKVEANRQPTLAPAAKQAI